MIYQYRCTVCTHVTEAWRSVAERHDTPLCEDCGQPTLKLVSDPGRVKINSGKGSRIPGVCTTLPGEPVYVRNKQHFRELCKERNAGDPVNL